MYHYILGLKSHQRNIDCAISFKMKSLLHTVSTKEIREAVSHNCIIIIIRSTERSMEQTITQNFLNMIDRN